MIDVDFWVFLLETWLASAKAGQIRVLAKAPLLWFLNFVKTSKIGMNFSLAILTRAVQHNPVVRLGSKSLSAVDREAATGRCW